MQSVMESTGHIGSTSYMACDNCYYYYSAFIDGVIYLSTYTFFFFKEKSVPSLGKQST